MRKNWTTLLLMCLPLQVLAADTIKLGLNYPSTGRYKEQGIAQARGALMAVEEINNAGGINGKKLELLTANTASKPDKAVGNVKKLAAQGVSMLFGGSSSAVAIAAGKEAKKHDLLYFGTLTYANATTGKEGHSHMFRETYNAWMTAKALAFYLNQDLQGKKVFYITADYSWGHSTESSLRNFTNTQDELAHPNAIVKFPRPRQSDLEEALVKARDSGADLLMLIQFGDDLATSLRLAYNMGLKKEMDIVIPNITLGAAKTVGAGLLEGIISTVPWCWRVPYLYGFEKGKRFVENFTERFQMYPSTSAATAYTIVYQFKEAVERAGSLKTAKLIKALEGHTYTSLKDPQTWRAFDHQSVQSVYVVRHKKRKDVLADKYNEDYFDVVLNIPGNTAVRSFEQWSDVRKKAGKPAKLQ